MRQKAYSIKEYLENNNYTNIDDLLIRSNDDFKERFGMNFSEKISVELKFESFQDANEFYQELTYNTSYKEYTVKTSNQANVLTVYGAKTLFEYFGTKEPNLLTVSRDLNISFDIHFVQSYSGTVFTGSVVSGELLSRQCIIEVSDVLPELTLAGLSQIAKSIKEFDLLLTRLYSVEGVSLI